MAISLKPETIFSIGSVEITNSIITVTLVAALIIYFVIVFTKKITVKPGSKFQLLIESAVIALHDLGKGILGDKAARHFFPFIFTFFTLILLSNWSGLLPFVGSIGFTHTAKEAGFGLPVLVIGNQVEDKHKEKDGALIPKKSIDIREIYAATSEEKLTTQKSIIRFTKGEEIEKPFFRAPSADLNFTLAMAIISFLLIQYAGLRALGFKYLGKFFDYRVSIPKGRKVLLLPFLFIINILWKTLELILEFGKIISFTFRLFGNVFAGEVLLLVITSLTFGLATLPFIGLEFFVGFIQAVVFSLLTMVFIKLASESHDGHAEEADAA